MPASKKKGKGGGGKSKKKGAKGAADKEEVVKLCKSLLKTYQLLCAAAKSTASPQICQEIRKSIENETALSKFVLEPSQTVVARSSLLSSKQKSRGSSSQSSTKTPLPTANIETGVTARDKEEISPRTESTISAQTVSPILLQPLVNSWDEAKYNYVRSLHVWSLELLDDAVVTLALFLESALGPNIKVLELRETKLSSWAICRLSKSLVGSQLTMLNLDFNHIDSASLSKLCEALQKMHTLSCLSLNFCQLGSCCGEPLGMLTATSQIKEISLIGNHLECDGLNEFLRPMVSLAEAYGDATRGSLPQAPLHAGTNTTELVRNQPEPQALLPPSSSEAPPHDFNPSATTQLQTPPTLPQTTPPMPPLAKLFVQDNCIDVHGECTDMDGVFASVLCMRALKRYVVSSPFLEEVNLEGNWIGEGGAREVMLMLQQRKEAGLPAVKMRVSPRICPEIFTEIVELNAMSGTKKKKGKAKKKKK